MSVSANATALPEATPFNPETWTAEGYRRGYNPVDIIQRDGSSGLYQNLVGISRTDGDLEFHAMLHGANPAEYERRLSTVLDWLIENGLVVGKRADSRAGIAEVA